MNRKTSLGSGRQSACRRAHTNTHTHTHTHTHAHVERLLLRLCTGPCFVRATDCVFFGGAAENKRRVWAVCSTAGGARATHVLYPDAQEAFVSMVLLLCHQVTGARVENFLQLCLAACQVLLRPFDEPAYTSIRCTAVLSVRTASLAFVRAEECARGTSPRHPQGLHRVPRRYCGFPAPDLAEEPAVLQNVCLQRENMGWCVSLTLARAPGGRFLGTSPPPGSTPCRDGRARH